MDIGLYHSGNDGVVDLDHMRINEKALPDARIRILKGASQVF
ncbi:hypothetical protein [Arachidicoccus terrestris]|nr:hypothetical protein [Arachidicoccus terrestris]